MVFFSNPEYLWLLALIPPSIFFYFKTIKKKQKQALKFSSLEIIRKALKKEGKPFSRNNLLFLLQLLVFGLLVIALSNPHIPLEQEKQGANIVLAIDVSGSMTATDYTPNRIEAAKIAAKTLIKNLKPKDTVGITTFAENARVIAFLTPIKENAINKLDSITASEGATAIGDGLLLAIDMVSSIPNKKKIVVLLSDGVNNAGATSPEQAIKYAKKELVQVYTVGIGSPGKTLIGYDFFGRPQYAELDEETLKKIAFETNGKYFKSVNNQTLNQIYSTISKEIKREKIETSIKDWFIIIAIILTIIYGITRFAWKKVIQ